MKLQYTAIMHCAERAEVRGRGGSEATIHSYNALRRESRGEREGRQ